MGIHEERVGPWTSFDGFFEAEHERLYKALYFVTGSRQDAEELMQDAFLKLWERWDRISTIKDPTGYLFRVALNGFRMRRRRAAMVVRKSSPSAEVRDEFKDAEMRADVRQLLHALTPRQRAALMLVDLLEYPSDQAAGILGVRASTAHHVEPREETEHVTSRQAVRSGSNDHGARGRHPGGVGGNGARVAPHHEGMQRVHR